MKTQSFFMLLMTTIMVNCLTSCSIDDDDNDRPTIVSFADYTQDNIFITDDGNKVRPEIDCPKDLIPGSRYDITFSIYTKYSENDWGVKMIKCTPIYVIDLVEFNEGDEDIYGNDAISGLVSSIGGNYINFSASYYFTKQDDHIFTLLKTGYDEESNTIFYQFRHNNKETQAPQYIANETLSANIGNIIPEGKDKVDIEILYNHNGTTRKITGTYSK